MLLLKKNKDLAAYLAQQKKDSRKIGFVPTMGALHEGHLSLIRAAQDHGQHVVCSIFVNPTQFNEQKDLDTYPRTPHKDIEMLERVGCDVLYMPEVDEVYPPELDTRLDLDFGQLDKVMEGAFRPGHFDGVAQVVKRLLDIVRPDSLYMGQKDYQQLSIIRYMIGQLALPVRLIMCPIIREEDGLAMSSRNVRLSPEIRQKAPVVYQTLLSAKEWLAGNEPSLVERKAMEALTIPGFQPEYFKIVDTQTLQQPDPHAETRQWIACVAVWAGDVRLIDNMLL